MTAKSFSELEVLIAVPNKQVAQGIQNMLRLRKVHGAKIALNSNEAISIMATNTRFNLFFISQDLQSHGGIDFCRFIRLTDTPMRKADLILHMPAPHKRAGG